jgi:hypothetical protein
MTAVSMHVFVHERLGDQGSEDEKQIEVLRESLKHL